MIRLTFAQMRRSLGRLVAAGIAITLGAGFVTATLLAGTAMTRTTYDAVTSSFGQADLVVNRGEITAQDVAALTELSGVRSVHAHRVVGADTSGPGGRTYLDLTAPADDPALRSGTLTSGRFPASTGEVVLTTEDATLLGAEEGDLVTVTSQIWQDGDEVEEVTTTLQVVGILERPDAAFLASGPTALVAAAQLETLGGGPDGLQLTPWFALVAVQDDVAVASVQAAGQEVVEGAQVVTRDEAARQITEEITGQTDQLTFIVLGFAAVALLVAALVISNTFQVLVAQRTRVLALLRCVGADRSLLRRSVVLEALVVGLVASAAGILLGTALVQTVLVALNRTGTDVPLPDSVVLTAPAVLVPLAIGTVVTVLAALAPALAATRVSPLAALRPVDAPSLARRSGRVRGWASALLVAGGVAGLAGGVALAQRDLAVGLALGVLGGAVSFVGFVLASVFWVPRVVGWAGGLAARWGGPAARLAAANSVRNPHRTAATSGALFIGVTLVAMMSTGAASARVALTAELENTFPVDVAVGTVGDGIMTPALPAALAAEVEAVAGVDEVVELRGTTVEITGSDDGSGSFVDVRGLEPDEAGVLHRPGAVAELRDGYVLVPESVVSWTGVQDGATITVRRQTGEQSGSTGTATASPEAAPSEQAPEPAGTDGSTVDLVVVHTDLPGTAMIVTPGTLEEVDPAAPVSRLWVRLASLTGSEQAVTQIRQLASDSGVALDTVGAAVERAFYQRVVDTLLLVVVGLLGVAVVIALVGVTNTLSLSVLERRRESATLRALGLSRGRLRATLAIEGMLIAGVGALGGVVLGTVYGWAGARTLLTQIGPVGLVVPWGELGLAIGVALLAGLLASVLPARSAARTAPVAALAVE